MGNFAENLNLGNRVRPPPRGDVANSKRPLLIIPKVQLRLRVTRRSWQKLFAGKNFVKILVTAQTQFRSYSEQQRGVRK